MRTSPHARSIAAALASGVVFVACAIPTQSGDLGDLPDQKSFLDNNVSPFLEHRCGSLDCHGQVGRPLRIYSDWGLRKKAREDGSRETGATTNEERTANYYAVVGLEPENMVACYATEGQDRATFQLLLKPIGIENGGIRHKGGPVLSPNNNDSGWKCLFGWVSGKPDKNACVEAATLP